MQFPGMGLTTHTTQGSALRSEMPTRAESSVSHRRLHTPVLTADRGGTRVSISGRTGKDVVSPHGGILACLQEERDPDTWDQTLQCEWTLRTLC